MFNLFSDTHPEAEAKLIQLLRKAPPWRKLEMVDQLNQSVKLFVITGLRQRFPDASEAQLHHQLAGQLLGENLVCKAYGALTNEINHVA